MKRENTGAEAGREKTTENNRELHCQIPLSDVCFLEDAVYKSIQLITSSMKLSPNIPSRVVYAASHGLS
jgi:hypothetical protein